MAKCSIFKNKTKAELLAAMRTKHSQQQRNAVAKAAHKFCKYGTLFAFPNKCSVSNSNVGTELEGFDPVTRRWVAGELACIRKSRGYYFAVLQTSFCEQRPRFHAFSVDGWVRWK
eukprot:PhM_4_TR478/c2_g4_i2/m.27572